MTYTDTRHRLQKLLDPPLYSRASPIREVSERRGLTEDERERVERFSRPERGWRELQAWWAGR